MEIPGLENELQEVLNSLPFYVLIVDSDHNILMSNKAVFSQLGIEPAQLIGKYCPKMIHGLNEPFPGCPLEEAVQKGCSVEKEVYDPELKCWFRSSVFSIGIRTADGKEIYFHSLQDITKRKLLEKKNEEISEQFYQAQKMDALGQLALGIAHDFNNILTGIIGNTEILKIKTSDISNPDNKIEQNINQLMDLANSAKNLISQLLVFSRKSGVEMKSVDIHKSLKKAVDILKHSISKSITIEINNTATNYLVTGNDTHIQNMFLNIGINARDAMPEGGKLAFKTENIDIDTTNRIIEGLKEGRYIHISISDTGKGMDKETLNHIFEPFFTTKGIGQGTGLGLAVVFSTVEQSGGNIFVNSEPGKGTTFSIYLPLID